jgi:transcriptional regulator with XRE-family HTH domain
MPALPFTKAKLRAVRPKPAGYPESLKTLGDHIRARRIDLGLLQKDLADRLRADVFTVLNWEKNRTLPSIGWMPRIIGFLGYAPYRPPTSFEGWFEAVRRNLGTARAQVAKRMGIDPGTLARWLRQERSPSVDFRNRVRAALLVGGEVQAD